MEWSEALWYRDADKAVVGARFEREMITPTLLTEWLVAMATGETSWHLLMESLAPRVAALVAIELDVLGNAVREEAATMRAVAIRTLAEDESIVDIAQTLGLTRQAASRSANSQSDLSTRLHRALGDGIRSFKEAAT